MAQRISIVLEDDIDGGIAAETITFVLDGVTYEIDLSHDNAAKLREAMLPWTSHARRTGGRRSTKPAAPKNPTDNQKIREWAQAQGLAVSARGRISADVQSAYAASH